MSLSVSPLGQTNNPGAQIISLVAGSTAYTLSTAQSGSIISIPALDAACTITLPAVANAVGCKYDIVCRGLLGQILNITAPAGTMRGFAQQKADSAANAYTAFTVAGAGGTNTTIRITTAGGAANAVGDRVSIFCDGTYYYVQGFSSSVAAPAVFVFV
jgi:hypothetical protein